MGNDLPDYQIQTRAATLEATSFRGGLDADKPASPAAGDIYLARDTYILYVAMAAGSWTGFDAAILVQGVLTLYENMNANSKKVTTLAAPTANADAARKLDVDTVDAKLNDIDGSAPSRSLGTSYENDSGKLRFVTVSIYADAGNPTEEITIYSDSSDPPTTTIIRFYTEEGLPRAASFYVDPGDYYKVVAANCTIRNWHEWDLH